MSSDSRNGLKLVEVIPDFCRVYDNSERGKKNQVWIVTVPWARNMAYALSEKAETIVVFHVRKSVFPTKLESYINDDSDVHVTGSFFHPSEILALGLVCNSLTVYVFDDEMAKFEDCKQDVAIKSFSSFGSSWQSLLAQASYPEFEGWKEKEDADFFYRGICVAPELSSKGETIAEMAESCSIADRLMSFSKIPLNDLIAYGRQYKSIIPAFMEDSTRNNFAVVTFGEESTKAILVEGLRVGVMEAVNAAFCFSDIHVVILVRHNLRTGDLEITIKRRPQSGIDLSYFLEKYGGNNQGGGSQKEELGLTLKGWRFTVPEIAYGGKETPFWCWLCPPKNE